MLFIQIDENGEAFGNPVVFENLRQLFPNVSFALPVQPEDVERLGFGIYEYASQPEPGLFERVVECSPVRNEEGVYTQTWRIISMSDSEREVATEQQWMNVASQRNHLLYLCDWTQLADSNVDKAGWAVYRQALRDITEQSDPFNIVWPTPPQ